MTPPRRFCERRAVPVYRISLLFIQSLCRALDVRRGRGACPQAASVKDVRHRVVNRRRDRSPSALFLRGTSMRQPFALLVSLSIFVSSAANAAPHPQQQGDAAPAKALAPPAQRPDCGKVRPALRDQVYNSERIREAFSQHPGSLVISIPFQSLPGEFYFLKGNRFGLVDINGDTLVDGIGIRQGTTLLIDAFDLETPADGVIDRCEQIKFDKKVVRQQIREAREIAKAEKSRPRTPSCYRLSPDGRHIAKC